MKNYIREGINSIVEDLEGEYSKEDILQSIVRVASSMLNVDDRKKWYKVIDHANLLAYSECEEDAKQLIRLYLAIKKKVYNVKIEVEEINFTERYLRHIEKLLEVGDKVESKSSYGMLLRLDEEDQYGPSEIIY